jgi:hypothetical protein
MYFLIRLVHLHVISWSSRNSQLANTPMELVVVILFSFLIIKFLVDNKDDMRYN